MDVDLGDVDGLDLTSELLAERPAMLVVVLTAFVDSHILRRAAVAGACALLPKGGPLQELLDGLRNARRGELYVPASLLLDMVTGPAARGPRAPTRPPSPRVRPSSWTSWLTGDTSAGSPRTCPSRPTPVAGTSSPCCRSWGRTPSSRRS